MVLKVGIKNSSQHFIKISIGVNDSRHNIMFTLPVPIPDEEKKSTEDFIFTLLCSSSSCN